MLVILSQKVDSVSSYADNLFKSYHYPARYRNQLHEGDIFIYYQGNQWNKSQRYYFGVGTVGEIQTEDGENYYAKLMNCQRFKKPVPIYLPNGGYIEQLGFQTVRKKINPPWQSSIRPLSQNAFDYILNAADIKFPLNTMGNTPVNKLREELKLAVREFYVEGNSSAIYQIESIASAIGQAMARPEKGNVNASFSMHTSSAGAIEQFPSFLDYCKSMKMTYSYKPILILALLHDGDNNGCIEIKNAVIYFRRYYLNRKVKGLLVEKKPCIYLKDDITDDQIIENLIANPVKALVKSGYFFYNDISETFSISSVLWEEMDKSGKTLIEKICLQKLKDYYND